MKLIVAFRSIANAAERTASRRFIALVITRMKRDVRRRRRRLRRIITMKRRETYIYVENMRVMKPT
jgi:hypothetical protein